MFGSYEARKPTPGQLRYIAILTLELGMPEPKVYSSAEAGRLIRELQAERTYRRKEKWRRTHTR